ncbi:hypothetical protein BH20ACI3_BH20ACI3_23420 [soil metagenome]
MKLSPLQKRVVSEERALSGKPLKFSPLPQAPEGCNAVSGQHEPDQFLGKVIGSHELEYPFSNIPPLRTHIVPSYYGRLLRHGIWQEEGSQFVAQQSDPRGKRKKVIGEKSSLHAPRKAR